MKSTDKLEKLLGKHPRWNILKEKLSYGCEYPVKDLDEEVRLLDLKENLNRGNHKSAKHNEEHLEKAMIKKSRKDGASFSQKIRFLQCQIWNLLQLTSQSI